MVNAFDQLIDPIDSVQFNSIPNAKIVVAGYFNAQNKNCTTFSSGWDLQGLYTEISDNLNLVMQIINHLTSY